jgi:hypothetical protein
LDSQERIQFRDGVTGATWGGPYICEAMGLYSNVVSTPYVYMVLNSKDTRPVMSGNFLEVISTQQKLDGSTNNDHTFTRYG